jgi:methyl-accepting chemotaxis protein
VTSVKKVSDIIAEIAAASQEQSSGIDEVNKAVTQLDEVTQQNAALVEEAAAASKSMDDQASNLQELVSIFSIGDAMAEQAAPPARPRATAKASTVPSAGSDRRRGPKAARPAPARSRTASSASRADDADENWEEF